MMSRQPTFTEILFPPSFPSHPKRVEATRTIIQPDQDLFELGETVEDGANLKSRRHPPAVHASGSGGAA